MPATVAPAPDPTLPVSQISRGMTADAFAEQFGESLPDVLAMKGWQDGVDMVKEYARIEREVAAALTEQQQQPVDADAHDFARQFFGRSEPHRP